MLVLALACILSNVESENDLAEVECFPSSLLAARCFVSGICTATNSTPAHFTSVAGMTSAGSHCMSIQALRSVRLVASNVWNSSRSLHIRFA